jgi:hypothetical protein
MSNASVVSPGGMFWGKASLIGYTLGVGVGVFVGGKGVFVTVGVLVGRGVFVGEEVGVGVWVTVGVVVIVGVADGKGLGVGVNVLHEPGMKHSSDISLE